MRKSWSTCHELTWLKKQLPWTFWNFAIKHSAQMMNMIPGKYSNKLASPFMLVHGTHRDPRTWLPLFLLCYFHHNKDSNASHSKHQAHTLDRITVGRSLTSNALLVYNPRNQHYYEPDYFDLIHIDFHPWFTPPLSMMVASLSPSTEMILPQSANRIHPGWGGWKINLTTHAVWFRYGHPNGSFHLTTLPDSIWWWNNHFSHGSQNAVPDPKAKQQHVWLLSPPPTVPMPSFKNHVQTWRTIP